MRSLGIDVGVRKGLDLVLIETPRTLAAVHSHVGVADLPQLIAALLPDVVAIDSPPCFGRGAPRRTEVWVRQLGIRLYATPWEDAKKTRPFYDWMRAGFDVYAAAATAGFPLFAGEGYEGTAFEVYPYGAAVVLSGALRPDGVAKEAWRRRVLEEHGVETAGLHTIDEVDAALAALTGLSALEGRACWEGEPAEGVIVLPSREDELKAKYVRATAG